MLKAFSLAYTLFVFASDLPMDAGRLNCKEKMNYATNGRKSVKEMLQQMNVAKIEVTREARKNYEYLFEDSNVNTEDMLHLPGGLKEIIEERTVLETVEKEKLE